MKFYMHSPCADCPFRNDIAFYLHSERRQEIADALLYGDSTFACHKTVDYSRWSDEETEDYRHDGTEQHCAGALIVMAKSDQLWANKMVRLAAAFGLFDETALNMDAPVVDSMREFVEGEPT